MGTEATVASVAKNAITLNASDSLDIHHRWITSTDSNGDRRLAFGGETIVGWRMGSRIKTDGGAQRRWRGAGVGGLGGRFSSTLSSPELEQSAQHSNDVRGISPSCRSSICQKYVVHSSWNAVAVWYKLMKYNITPTLT